MQCYLGKGQVLVFGVAMAANTLGDLDIVHQMALKMGCAPLFGLSDWADVRISRGENGSFLFVNNYQDDPVETELRYGEATLFGGSRLKVPARQGLILPLDWQPRPGVMIHYVTAEITAVTEDGSMLTIHTSQPDFSAELTLTGYSCEEAGGTSGRVKIRGRDGQMVLRRH